MIGLAAEPPAALIVAGGGSVLDGAPRGVLIAVAGMLDQFLLGLLKPLGLALSGLAEGPLCLAGGAFGGDGFRAGASPYGRRLGGRAISFLERSIWSWHPLVSTPDVQRQTRSLQRSGRMRCFRSVA